MALRIDDRNDDGRGRGLWHGRVALVSQAHPGEEIDFHVDKRTRGTLQGRVERLVSADPRRLAHTCQHEFRCTGCALLACHPDDELAFKADKIRAALAPLPGAAELLGPLLRPAGPFGYRAYAKQIFARRQGQIILGSYVSGTHEVVSNAACPVLRPGLAGLIDVVLRAVKDLNLPIHDETQKTEGLRYLLARESVATGDQLLVLSTSGDVEPLRNVARAIVARAPKVRSLWALENDDPGDALTAGTPELLHGAEAIEEELLGYRHAIGPTSFFQVNPVAATELFRIAVDAAGKGEVCLEACAGVGALTLPLSEHFGRVIGIESNPEAAAALGAAASRYQRSGISIYRARIEDVLAEQLASSGATTLVADPPRKGLGAALMERIGTSKVDRVVLLSCAPETLAVDGPGLVRAGFRVSAVTGVDQFPRTGHVETVTVFSRSTSSSH